MFWHLYYYRLKILLKTKILIFWTLIFPILMGLFFTSAFSNLDNLDSLKQVPVGIVKKDKSAISQVFLSTIKQIKTKDTKMLNVKEMSEETAKKQMINEKIAGYYMVENNAIQLVVNKKEMQQNMLDSVLNQFLQGKEKILTIQKEAPELLQSAVMEKIGKTENYVYEKQVTASSGSLKSFFFFTLIGMSCMFGMFWSLANVNDEQANQSSNGIRLSMSPQNKIRISFANLLASFTIFIVEIYFILGVYHFVYGVDFGQRWPLILLTCCLAVLMALSFGTLLANILRVSLTKKNSITVSIQIVLSFCAGMMGPEVKRFIQEHFPLFNKVNPVNVVSEALYKLYYYQSIDSFYSNLWMLVILTIVFTVTSIFYEKRVQYVSI